MKLTVVIPTYNEQMTMDELVGRVRAVDFGLDYEILIVDDASVDRSYEKEIRLMYEDSADRIRVFKNRMNRGKGFSIRKGIRHASGDLVVIQDADTEYDPREIPALLAPVLRGEADAVYGSRFLRARRPKGMGFLSLAANIVLTRLTNALYGLRLTDMETCYKVIRADLLKTLPLREDRFAFEPEVTAWLARKRARIVELPIGYSGRGRKEGKKIKARDFFYALVALARCRVQPMAGGAS